MKVVALADTHGRHREVEVPPGDVLLVAGDLTGYGSLRDLVDFNRWVAALPHEHKLVTAGNHDSCLLDAYGRSLVTGAMLCIDEEVVLGGTSFYLSPSARRWGQPAFTVGSGAEAEAKWGMIPPGVDVLVTHGPPYGVLDIDEEVTGDVPQGCPVLRDWVEKHRPRYHVFGHIHKRGGRWAGNGKTAFVNCSVQHRSEHGRPEHPTQVFWI